MYMYVHICIILLQNKELCQNKFLINQKLPNNTWYYVDFRNEKQIQYINNIIQILRNQMIPIYNSVGKRIFNVSMQQLTENILTVNQELERFELPLLETYYFNKNNSRIELNQENIQQIKFVLALEDKDPSAYLQAFKFYARKTDRKGISINDHSFVTFKEVSTKVQEILSVGMNDQEVYYQGFRIEDLDETLRLRNVQPFKFIHIVDITKLSNDQNVEYVIQVEGARKNSGKFELTVKGNQTIAELKALVSQKINITYENILIIFKGAQIQNQQSTLFENRIGKGSQIKIVNTIDGVSKSEAAKIEDTHKYTLLNKIKYQPKQIEVQEIVQRKVMKNKKITQIRTEIRTEISSFTFSSSKKILCVETEGETLERADREEQLPAQLYAQSSRKIGVGESIVGQSHETQMVGLSRPNYVQITKIQTSVEGISQPIHLQIKKQQQNTEIKELQIIEKEPRVIACGGGQTTTIFKEFKFVEPQVIACGVQQNTQVKELQIIEKEPRVIACGGGQTTTIFKEFKFVEPQVIACGVQQNTQVKELQIIEQEPRVIACGGGQTTTIFKEFKFVEPQVIACGVQQNTQVKELQIIEKEPRVLACGGGQTTTIFKEFKFVEPQVIACGVQQNTQVKELQIIEQEPRVIACGRNVTIETIEGLSQPIHYSITKVQNAESTEGQSHETQMVGLSRPNYVQITKIQTSVEGLSQPIHLQIKKQQQNTEIKELQIIEKEPRVIACGGGQTTTIFKEFKFVEPQVIACGVQQNTQVKELQIIEKEPRVIACGGGQTTTIFNEFKFVEPQVIACGVQQNTQVKELQIIEQEPRVIACGRNVTIETIEGLSQPIHYSITKVQNAESTEGQSHETQMVGLSRPNYVQITKIQTSVEGLSQPIHLQIKKQQQNTEIKELQIIEKEPRVIACGGGQTTTIFKEFKFVEPQVIACGVQQNTQVKELQIIEKEPRVIACGRNVTIETIEGLSQPIHYSITKVQNAESTEGQSHETQMVGLSRPNYVQITKIQTSVEGLSQPIHLQIKKQQQNTEIKELQIIEKEPRVIACGGGQTTTIFKEFKFVEPQVIACGVQQNTQVKELQIIEQEPRVIACGRNVTIETIEGLSQPIHYSITKVQNAESTEGQSHETQMVGLSRPNYVQITKIQTSVEGLSQPIHLQIKKQQQNTEIKELQIIEKEPRVIACGGGQTTTIFKEFKFVEPQVIACGVQQNTQVKELQIIEQEPRVIACGRNVTIETIEGLSQPIHYSITKVQNAESTEGQSHETQMVGLSRPNYVQITKIQTSVEGLSQPIHLQIKKQQQNTEIKELQIIEKEPRVIACGGGQTTTIFKEFKFVEPQVIACGVQQNTQVKELQLTSTQRIQTIEISSVQNLQPTSLNNQKVSYYDLSVGQVDSNIPPTHEIVFAEKVSIEGSTKEIQESASTENLLIRLKDPEQKEYDLKIDISDNCEQVKTKLSNKYPQSWSGKKFDLKWKGVLLQDYRIVTQDGVSQEFFIDIVLREQSNE